MAATLNQVSSLWRYLPVAEEDDRHPDFRTGSVAGSGVLHSVAATVRGKQHKHNGTNCDDWFEIRSCGPWMLAAVADGAGSCRLSRVGARISTNKAIESMTAALESVRDESNGIEHILENAADEARLAVLEEAARRECDPALLSATLLLAAYCDLGEEGLAVTWQVGDGLLAAITPTSEVCTLNRADSGSYAGETNFLPFLADPYRRPARIFRGPIRSLLMMTDGIADDYFPPATGSPLLEADLALNGILPQTGGDAVEVDCEYESAVLLEGGPVPVRIRRAAAGLPAGARLRLPDSERLALWLGGYQVRGSSDDRTLVAIYRAT